MLGTLPHFPLRVIIAHVTLLTGPWIQSFLLGEAVSGMALVTGVVLVSIPFITEFLLLSFGLDAHVVTTSAAPSTFHQLVGLNVGYWKCIHGCPAKVVFSLYKLIKLFLMALGAEMFVRQNYKIHIVPPIMFVAVAYRTCYIIFAVFT